MNEDRWLGGFIAGSLSTAVVVVLALWASGALR